MQQNLLENPEALLPSSLGLLNQIQLPVLAYCESGEIIFANNFVKRSLGYEPDELLGKKIQELILEPIAARANDKSYLFREGKASGPYLLLKPGIPFEQVAAYIGWFEANLHSVKAHIQVTAIAEGCYLAFFSINPHRIAANTIETNMDLLVRLDPSDRIFEYSNTFFLKHRTFAGNHSLNDTLFADFLAPGEWDSAGRKLRARGRYLKDKSNEIHAPWNPVAADDFSDPALSRWKFDAEGVWRIENRALTGCAAHLSSYAIFDYPLPSNQDIRIGFELRGPYPLSFGAFCFGRPGKLGATPDESGYLLSVSTNASEDSPGCLAVIKKFREPLHSVELPEIPADKWMRCVVEKTGGRLTLMLEDRILCEYFDLNPLLDKAPAACGFVCGKRTEFRNLEISTRSGNLDPARLTPELIHVHLRHFPEETYEMTITDMTAHGDPFRLIRLHDVTRLKKAEEALAQTENAHARLMIEHRALKEQLAHAGESLIGESSAMRKIRTLLQTVAQTDAHVLLTGETGTGKDVAARALHELSRRKSAPFIKIDCAALPPSLLETELFGHEKGAFTGAVERHTGRLEAAGEGTIFLDEIGNLDVALQAKLLRVLQDKTFERVGGTQTLTLKARIVSATNANLHQQMARGLFRGDLFYRLNAVTVELPPLRERTEDVPVLAASFLKTICETAGRPVPRISEAAMNALRRHPWPGNVRELKNVVEYLAHLISHSVIETADLPTFLRSPERAAQSANPRRRRGRTPPRLLAKSQIQNAIKQAGGNMAHAARLLRIGRDSLYRLLKRHGIRP